MSRNVAIVVAHPGHELVVHHYMEVHRPLYFCLTDGSGGNAQSRLASTDRLIDQVGARRGSIYGRFSDKDVYRLLLEGRVDVFVELLNELGASLIEADIHCVAGDAMEGFNPGHDVCRALIDSAVAIVQARTGRAIENYEFAVHNNPATDPEGALIRLDLDDDAFERKIAAAMAYREITDDVQDALDRFGRDAFAVECLRPSSTRAMLEQFETTPPSYESIGEGRVRDGRYREVVRYREHVAPVFRALGIF
jgi:AcrR family transcriptional regulator